MRIATLLRRGLGAVALTLASVTFATAAAPFPTRPIRIIVPTAPGGALDLTTRLFAQKMSENLGQSIIVDNRPGAETLLGTRMAMGAAPDGYTILAQSNGFTLAPLVKQDPGYDPLKDFIGIGFTVRSPLLMEVGASQPDQTVADFVARAKAGRLTYASAGNGSAPQISAALFFRKQGLTITHVPYKGNGPALPDVAGGRVDTIFDGYISSISYLRGNKLRPLAVTSATRIPPLPDVPTFKELGFDYTYTLWLGLVAPAGVPSDVIDRLSEALRYAANDKELGDRLRSEGSDPSFVSAKDFNAYLAKEVTDMVQLAQDLNLARE